MISVSPIFWMWNYDMLTWRPPLRRSFQNCGILRATTQSQGCRILDASMKIWRPVRWRKVWLSLKPTVPWSGWWFRTCFIFPYIGNNDPNRPLMHSAGQILPGPACRFSWILESWLIFGKTSQNGRTFQVSEFADSESVGCCFLATWGVHSHGDTPIAGWIRMEHSLQWMI